MAVLLIGFIGVMVVSFAVWRGFPPFHMHSAKFPGLLQTTAVQPRQTAIKIYKAERTLQLYGDGQLLGVFKIALGSAPLGDKEREGDGKTPEGKFVVCYINNNTTFIHFYGLSYPNAQAAERGLKQGLISPAEYRQIVQADQSGGMPLWKTPLGGEVGIHGGGNWQDWTRGCVALSDADICTLSSYITIGTPVEILP